MANSTKMVRGYNWSIIVFFAVTTLVAVVGTPLYLHHYRISLSEILLTLFFVVVTGMSITVGYHRLYAHSAFKTNPFVEFLVLFFGAAAFEQPALIWCSGHRDHHRYVDTEQDPYSIKKGFWYAHIGWMTLWKQEPNFDNVPDLMKNKLLMHQNKHYMFWAAGAGIVFPVLLGAMMGHALGAFIFAVCVRLTFVYHATFCINSVCHTFGKATYDIDATAKDHWFVAILTNGEGYHNYHHHFPTDYRNGIRWYHWDPSKWAIAFLGKVGWATGLRRTPVFQILRARLASQKLLLSRSVHSLKGPSRAAKIINWNYHLLEKKLQEWETSGSRAAFEARRRRLDLWIARAIA